MVRQLSSQFKHASRISRGHSGLLPTGDSVVLMLPMQRCSLAAGIRHMVRHLELLSSFVFQRMHKVAFSLVPLGKGSFVLLTPMRNALATGCLKVQMHRV